MIVLQNLTDTFGTELCSIVLYKTPTPATPLREVSASYTEHLKFLFGNLRSTELVQCCTTREATVVLLGLAMAKQFLLSRKDGDHISP